MEGAPIRTFIPQLALAGLLFTLNTAVAQDDPKIAVVGIHQPGLTVEDQVAASTEIADALNKAKTVEPLVGDEVLRTIAGRQEVIVKQALMDEGRRLLADGRNLYNQALPEEAIPALESAIETLTLGLAASNDFDELWEAWIYLGTARIAVDDNDGAAEAFGRAVALNSNRVPDGALFPPFVIEAFNTSREALVANPATVTIEANLPNVTLFVNGVDQGEAPVTVTNAMPGYNYVVARGEGVMGFAELELTAGENENATVYMGEPTLGLAESSAARRSRQIDQLYEAFGEHAAGVDLILLAGTQDDELKLQLYAVRSKAFGPQLSLPYSGKANDEAAAGVVELMTQLDETGRLPAGSRGTASPLSIEDNSLLATLLTQDRTPAPMPGPAPVPGGKRNKWVVPVLASVGAAAVGTTVAVLATSGGGPEPTGNPFQGVVTVGPF